MTQETAEQLLPAITDTAPITDGAVETATEPVVEPVDGGGEAVAVTTPVSFDLSTDEGIRAAVEANPTLRGYLDKTKADAENTARQRRDAELRREQGTIERAQAYHQWLIGEMEKGTDPESLRRQLPLYVKANHDSARLDLAQRMLEHAASLLEPTEAEPLRAMAARIEPDDAEAFTNVSQAAVNAVIAKVRAQEKAGFEAERAKIEAEFQKKYEAKLAAELEAAKVEARTSQVTNPPQVSGQAVTAQPADIDLQRLVTQGIPLVEEATRKRIAAQLGVSL